MSANRFRIAGLDELIADLRKLPAELTDDGGAIVRRAAEKTQQETIAAYPERSGDLKSKVTLTVDASRAGVVARVSSKAKDAHLYEFGTQLRHRRSGASTGQEPAHPTLVPIAERNRATMNHELVELVRRAGMQVSGDGV